MSSKQDQALANEAFMEAQALLAVECPDADLTALDGAPEAFDAGVWFGIAAATAVLGRHGHLRRRRFRR